MQALILLRTCIQYYPRGGLLKGTVNLNQEALNADKLYRIPSVLR